MNGLSGLIISYRNKGWDEVLFAMELKYCLRWGRDAVCDEVEILNAMGSKY